METDIEKRKRVHAELQEAVEKLEALNEKLKAFNEAHNLKAPVPAPKAPEPKVIEINVNLAWVITCIGAGLCAGIVIAGLSGVYFGG
jgi:hypothetical protein